MAGEVTKPKPKRHVAAVVEREPPTAIALVEPNGKGSADPNEIRPALAQATAAHLPELRQTLLDAALNSSTMRWATVSCSGCGARSRVEVPVPDTKARLEAVRLLIDQGLGKTPTAPEPVAASWPKTPGDVSRLSWEQMQYLHASIYIDDVREVMRLGGRQAVRAKLRLLSDPERQLLREALAETSPA